MSHIHCWGSSGACLARLHHCSYCHRNVNNIFRHRCNLMVALGVPLKTKRPDEKCA